MHKSSYAAVPLVALLAGCGTGGQPWASPAEKDVHRRAGNAGPVMARAEQSESALEHARRVVGGEQDAAQITVLEAAGTGTQGHVVLRISSVHDDDSPLDRDSSAVACFRYEFGDRSGSTEADEVSCPDRGPIVMPPPPFEPQLPFDGASRLTDLLRSGRSDAGKRHVSRARPDGAHRGAGRDHRHRRRSGAWPVPRRTTAA